MKLFAIVSCFPSFFESDKESNIFEPVIAPKRSRDTKDTGINHNSIEFSDVSLGHKCYYDSLTPSSTSDLGTSRSSSSSSSTLTASYDPYDKSHEEYNSTGNITTSEVSKEDFSQLDSSVQKKYDYLSSNLVETNQHVLGLYKKIRALEIEELQNLKDSIEILAGRLEANNVMQSTKEIENLNTQTDIVYLKHKLEKLTEKVSLLESKLDGRLEPEKHDHIFELLNQNGNLVHTAVSSNKPSQQRLQSSLLRFLLPSVVTVTAIVINMYLYLSTSVKKFPF